MKVSSAVIVVIICAVITLCAIFAAGIFQAVATESGTCGNLTPTENATVEAGTIAIFGQVSAWIYIVAALLMIAVIIIALKLARGVVK